MKRSLNIRPFVLFCTIVTLLFIGCSKGGNPQPQTTITTPLIPYGVYMCIKKEKKQTDGSYQTLTMTSCESGTSYGFDKSNAFAINSIVCSLDAKGTWTGDKSTMTLVAYSTDGSGNRTTYLNGTVSNIGADSRGDALFTITQDNGLRLTLSSISLY
jgi:hypothetical protein